METRSEEKHFCASESGEPCSAEYGPFKTAEEAEEQARIFGWSWVVCYTHVLVFDKIVDVKTRYYEIDTSDDPALKGHLGRSLADAMKGPDDPRRFLNDIRQQAMAPRKCAKCREGSCTEHRPDTRLAPAPQEPFDTSPVKQMSAADAAFFASLEKQMKE